MNLFSNGNSFYLICANPLFGKKNLVPEIGGKMLSINQIARFLN